MALRIAPSPHFAHKPQPPVSLAATEYQAMQAGDPIRYELADCFVDYLRSTKRWDLLTIDQAFQFPVSRLTGDRRPPMLLVMVQLHRGNHELLLPALARK
jgi:hypothetical protein